jgi:hypothetical protein
MPENDVGFNRQRRFGNLTLGSSIRYTNGIRFIRNCG